MLESVPSAAWAGLTAVIGSIAGWLTTRGKNEADITAALTESASEWIRDLQAERKEQREVIKALRTEVHECEVRHDEVSDKHDRLEDEHDRLVTWLRTQGLDYPGQHEAQP